MTVKQKITEHLMRSNPYLRGRKLNKAWTPEAKLIVCSASIMIKDTTYHNQETRRKEDLHLDTNQK